MNLKPDQKRVQILLIDTIASLCRNGLSYHNGIAIQGVIGITVDKSEVFLVHINQNLSICDDGDGNDGSTGATKDQAAEFEFFESDKSNPKHFSKGSPGNHNFRAENYQNSRRRLIPTNVNSSNNTNNSNNTSNNINNNSVSDEQDHKFPSPPSFSNPQQQMHDYKPLIYQPSYESPVNSSHTSSTPNVKSIKIEPHFSNTQQSQFSGHHNNSGSSGSNNNLHAGAANINNPSVNNDILENDDSDCYINDSQFLNTNQNYGYNASPRGSGCRRTNRRRGGRRGGATQNRQPMVRQGENFNMSTSWGDMMTTSFVCKVCGQSFVHKSNLLGHQIRIHGRQKNKRGRPPTNNSINLSNDNETVNSNNNNHNNSTDYHNSMNNMYSSMLHGGNHDDDDDDVHDQDDNMQDGAISDDNNVINPQNFNNNNNNNANNSNIVDSNFQQQNVNRNFQVMSNW
ncbi:hypothetical protein HELRODRAFT_165590 [Helobdella robusta]|uniref:C2H2-type domain-containing protein n=1 Tax=Helobdella robusta TaxID=6412 RepID=T1EX16_HELRO|nr:hypothetical protein HELRODRAFT_165590 [Helobdella robusta]ESN91537.1 hypothetical protein HELRODRAFT_165590 [Helobdella robusta]